MTDVTGRSGQAIPREAAADGACPCSDPADLVEQLNRGYLCPAWAGPAWRQAHAAGVDMSLLEEAMRRSPSERLREHQRALNLVLEVVRTRSTHDSGQTPQRLPFRLDDRLCRELRNLHLRTDLGVIDCLGEVAGIGPHHKHTTGLPRREPREERFFEPSCRTFSHTEQSVSST